jgi:aldehyde:ferredoxin oxidoreductase
MYGWMGSVLRVDLSEGKAATRDLDPAFARKFLGGRGFNSRVLWEEIRPGTDPLSPENVLCIAPGMLTGTPLALTGRVSVSTLSPLTGILGDGSGGGEFAWQLKRAGFDQVVVTGRAKKPVYLLLDGGEATLMDAASLSGRDTWETTGLLEEVHGKGTSVACIGQAGENMVRFASLIFDRYSSAAPGSGAVMGAKNLKAVVARGTGNPALAAPGEFRDLAREDRKYFLEDPFFRDQVGKTGSLVGVEDWGPGFRNSQARWRSEDVPGDLRAAAWKQFETGRTGCHGCPVRCKNVFRIPSGSHAGEQGEGLEYEAIHWLGINSGILDPIAILEMSNLADRYGMDVIGLGSAIAYAKELFSRGLLTAKDTGGLSLAWEDAGSQVELIHMIARREGFGAVLAGGMLALARKMGGEAEKYCFHVKGVSRGVYPAGLYSLAHATSTRGADHLRGRTWALGENEPDLFADLAEKGYIPRDEVAALQAGERATTLADALGRCKGAVNTWRFAVPLVWKYPLWEGVVRIIRAATGVDFTGEELETTLDRIYLQEMAFNARQGIRRADDRMPQRPEFAATPEGAKDRERFDELLTRYYLLHGCDPETGVPTKQRLEELGLPDVAGELGRIGPEISRWKGPVELPAR